MKRTLSLVLALVMVLGSFGTVFAADTADKGEAGAFLEKVGVLQGDDNGNLMLEKTLLRRDMVVLLSRLMGIEEKAKVFPSEELTFGDITDHYYKGFIAWSVYNELIEGHSPKLFGFNENVTAQQYVTVLMRALGYEVDDMAYNTILDTSKDLGLTKGLDLKDDDEITRGQMAVLTLNALGTEIKDSKMTLAESLKIEMPEEPAAKELKVESVNSENLRDIVVELSNAKLAKIENLEDASNYRVDGNTAKRVTIDGNNLIVELKETLDEDEKYDLRIINVDKDIDGTYKFTAKDNSVPRVEEVEALGEYGIKVTLSEPVKDVKERDFSIDDRNISMKTEQYGRIIILRPYSGSFPSSAKELTIESLEDFAGYRSARSKFDIEIAKDNIAPKVTDVIVRDNLVEVTFDKDIYEESVKGHKNRSDLGNISYRDGRIDFYAEDGAEKTNYNKVQYKFKERLPRNVTVTIEGVENHSRVAMEKTNESVREVIDYNEPKIIETDVKSKKDGTTRIELTFDKEVEGSFKTGSDDTFKAEDHFTLYNYGEVLERNKLTAGSDFKFVSAKYDGDDKDVIVLVLKDLEKNVGNSNKFDYVLEVKDFTDTTSLKNKMLRYYVDFEYEEVKDFEVKEVSVEAGSRSDEKEIVITFSKEVDKRTTDVLENYTFKDKDNKTLDLYDLDGKISYQSGSEEVVLIIRDYNKQNLKKIILSNNIKDKEDGQRLIGDREWDL